MNTWSTTSPVASRCGLSLPTKDRPKTASAGFAKVLCARKCAHRWLQVQYEGMIPCRFRWSAGPRTR